MKPFNLEEAKAGKPLVTRDGRDAKFIAHVPECSMTNRVLGYIKGRDMVYDYSEKGIWMGGDGKDTNDLFMKTVKKTVYVNLYDSGHYLRYTTKEIAESNATVTHPANLVAIAVPIEIEE